MNLTFRQSELWEPCDRNWALNYRKGLVPVRERASKAGLGTLVHKGLEHFYLGAINWWGPVEALWEEGAAGIEDRPEWVKEYEKERKLAKVMLDGYVQWVEETGADVGWTVTGVERQLTTHWGTYDVAGVGTVDVTVTGKADLEVLDEFEQPLLVDHKTRDSLKTGPHDNMDPQRLTYAVLRMMEDGVQYRGAVHNILRRTQRTSRAVPPFYGRHALHFTVDQLRKHYRKMDARIQRMVPLAAGIEAGTIDLDDPRLGTFVHRDCDWRCPFIEVCPMFDDGSDWEWSLNELFKPSEES